jgi:hypothetical protein
MIELPPLPYGASPTYGYTEAEMRAYGEACARAALEAAANACWALPELKRGLKDCARAVGALATPSPGSGS